MRAFIRFNLLIVLAGMVIFSTSAAWCQTLFPKSSQVSQSCGVCHKADAKGRLEVIEETRKSPEEWKNVVDRMIRLNGTVLADDLFYPVVKELSRSLGLTPDEMARVSYYNSDENSQYREIPKTKLEERIFAACVRCHTYGKIASHRMTPAQWNENRNLHMGYYPTTVPQMREMNWTQESKDLLEPLAKLFPFEAEEWKKWLQNRKDQNLNGRWVGAGFQPGMGYYTSVYTFKPDTQAGADEYILNKFTRYASGLVVTQEGTGTLYSEYHLRYALAPTALTGRTEGVFDLDTKNQRFSGQWWTVVQDSNTHAKERFARAGGSARIVAVFPAALKVGGTSQVTIVGTNLPAAVKASAIRFSDKGVQVTKITRSKKDKIICEVKVSKQAKPGKMRLNVADTAYDRNLVLFGKMDGIKILPPLARARVSCGAAYPPHGVQFVAYGLDFGADGKPDTADDVMLEPVTASWWLEEEKTRDDDDDLKILQAPIVNGLYTPRTTYGPIAARNQHREGIGLIAVGAAFKVDGRDLKDRALLGVTVPDFITHIK